MNEVRGFSAENKGLEQQARLSDVKSGVEEAKKTLSNADVSEEELVLAYENLQNLSVQAITLGDFAYSKKIIALIPTDAHKKLGESESKTYFKKELVYVLLRKCEFFLYGISDLNQDYEKEMRSGDVSDEQKKMIRKKYAQKADALLQSEELSFYFEYLVNEISTDKTLQKQMTESVMVVGLLANMLRAAATLGADEETIARLTQVLYVTPGNKQSAVVRTQAIVQAALSFAGVSQQIRYDIPEKTHPPLGGYRNIRQAFALLKESAQTNAQGRVLDSATADAYYAIIITHSTAILNYEVRAAEIKTIAENIRGSISKRSGVDILDGHVEAIELEEKARGQKSAA